MSEEVRCNVNNYAQGCIMSTPTVARNSNGKHGTRRFRGKWKWTRFATNLVAFKIKPRMQAMAYRHRHIHIHRAMHEPRISSHSPSSGATAATRMAGRPPLPLSGGESSDSPGRMTPISDHSVLMMGMNGCKNRQCRCLTRSFDQRDWTFVCPAWEGEDDPGGHSDYICILGYMYLTSVLAVVVVRVVNAWGIRHQRIPFDYPKQTSVYTPDRD